MKRLLLAAGLLGTGAAALVVLSLPPRRAMLPVSGDAGTVPGIIHVHTSRSDGRSAPADIAKNVVAAGIADRALVQLAYAIGVADPVSVMVHTEGTERIPEATITSLVRGHFKLTPRGIMDQLDLRRPIYKKTAAFGHFGRSEPEFTWERTDKAAALRAEAGL